MPITAEGLRFEYAPGTPFSHVALEDISVTIDDGSFTSLIGHTGSGKSTFIQLIAGLIKPTAGKIYLDGEDINQKGYDKKKHLIASEQSVYYILKASESRFRIRSER